MEDTKWVTSIEKGTTSKKTPMWTILWHDGASDTVFKEDWAGICEEAKANKLAIHYKKEKNARGYLNIVELSLVRDKLPEAVEPAKVETPDDTQLSKVIAKAVYKPDDKNRAFALSYAKDYIIAKMQKDEAAGQSQNVNDVVIVAEIFLQYLEGNITPGVAKVISSLNKR